MHPDVARTFHEAVKRSIPIISELLPTCTDPYMMWRHNAPTAEVQGWRGGIENVPNWKRIYFHSISKLPDITKEFTYEFARYYPEYSQLFSIGRMISASRFGSGFDIILSAIKVLYDRHSSLDVSEAAIISIVAEFSDFIDAPAIKICYTAQLLNFTSSDVDQINMSNGVFVKRLSEKEISAIHGRFVPVNSMDLDLDKGGIHEFALVVTCEEPKAFGEEAIAISRANITASNKLDKALIALRTFKPGHVGFDKIRGTSITFCPYDCSHYGHGNLFVPFGSYVISGSESKDLERHSTAFCSINEPAMEMACSRLADAENRTKLEDRIVDAVIGMEALLLIGARAELSFRFSLNYSMLFNVPQERERAFEEAHDLYSLRSVIAHGDTPNKAKLKIAGEKLTLEAAAEKATTALRKIISYFLHKTGSPYKNAHFWQRAYFGFPTVD